MKKIISTAVLVWMLLALPVIVWADTQTYTPPAKKGTIYIVLKFKYEKPGINARIKANVNWGSYKRSGTFTANFTTQAAGVVIKLNHAKDDSVEMTVTAEGGDILSINQSDSPPSQWNNSFFQKVSW